MNDRTAYVLLSGGQDSTTCLYWALREFAYVKAFGFNYGQKHAIELEQAQKIADLAGVEYEVFDLKGLLGGSSLTDHTKDHNEIKNGLPASFTAGRNALFLTLVASRAYQDGVRDIVTGVCQTDYSGYPDCRRNFVNAEEVTLGLAMDTDFRIHTPLMYLTKAETWKLAKELGCLEVVRTMTMTDYNGDETMHEWGMGNPDNPATKLRVKGYEEAKANGWLA